MEMARMLGPPHYYPYRQIPRASRVGSGPHVALIVLTGTPSAVALDGWHVRGSGGSLRRALAERARAAERPTVQASAAQTRRVPVNQTPPPAPGRRHAACSQFRGIELESATGRGFRGPRSTGRGQRCHGIREPSRAKHLNASAASASYPSNARSLRYGQRKSSTSCWNCRTFSTYLPTPSGSAEA
jgi:hypothetical protein